MKHIILCFWNVVTSHYPCFPSLPAIITIPIVFPIKNRVVFCLSESNERHTFQSSRIFHTLKMLICDPFVLTFFALHTSHIHHPNRVYHFKCQPFTYAFILSFDVQIKYLNWQCKYGFQVLRSLDAPPLWSSK